MIGSVPTGLDAIMQRWLSSFFGEYSGLSFSTRVEIGFEKHFVKERLTYWNCSFREKTIIVTG